MRSLQRGFRSFRRNYTRNLILVVLLFICLTFSMSMLSVKLAADSQVASVKRTLGNYGEVKVDSQYRMQQFQAEREKTAAQRQAEARTMTVEEELASRISMLVPETLTDAFSGDEHINTYDKVLETRVELPDVESTDVQQAFQVRDEQRGGPGGGFASGNSFTFSGNTNGSSASDFTTGAKELVGGEHFTYEDYQDSSPVVVIEENLAEENGLAVGDTIEAEISGMSGKASNMELEIIGIYRTVEADEQGGASGDQAAFNPAGSTFYAPVSVVQDLYGTAGYLSLGSYYFDSVDSTSELEAAFGEQAGSDGDKYKLAPDLSDYEAIADPLLKARNTSVIGLLGALGACALIILLAMFIIVGGRSRELGILKAIGSTNRQVISQFAVEVLCICLVAIVLAMGATAVIGQSMGNWLLPETKADSGEEAQVSGPGMMRMGPGSDSLYKEGSMLSISAGRQQKEAAELTVVYRGAMFAYGVLILVGLSLVGMAIPVLWIVRLRPARVLSME